MKPTIIKNMEELENSQLLSKIAREASIGANRENRALGLHIQLVEDGYVIEKFADGSKRTIKKLEKVKSKVSLKKGSVLCLKQKS
ncbi:hypothetical protein [Sphingobacterium sp. UDSM-2020]|uniref:hypothetical protein n=1 Tax=Sphingobacterium sp. UDSM-2020 TaxID=2795738 RepID=UPI0019390180|nr:hypothetical protein [Sphingobacterium sp. UDSM-2020]QQD13446.1 hypothetical protein JAZ75_23115 [Sphingobacterium sp. UDSM-2020]